MYITVIIISVKKIAEKNILALIARKRQKNMQKNKHIKNREILFQTLKKNSLVVLVLEKNMRESC
jgi:hypothetical protein